MITLRELGPDGLRRMLEEQRKGDGEGPIDSTLGLAVRSEAHLSRKASARARLLVDAQRHTHLIQAHVLKYYDSPEIRNEIIRHVDTLKNLQRMVTDRVAIAYNRPAKRSFRGELVTQEQSEAFLAAYREAKVDAAAERWNRYCFFLSVVHVIPRYENGRIRLVTVLPDTADALFYEGDDEPSILVYETTSHGAKWVAVDSEQWWWIRSDWTLAHDEEHGLGMRPWVPWRWQDPPCGDYWDRGAGQDLFDGTMELGRIYAHTRYIRKHWSKKLTTLHVGAEVHVPENQNLGSMQPAVAEGDGTYDVQVHDTIVGMTEFIAEMREITESVAEAYGFPPSLVDFSNTATDGSGKIGAHEALVKLRDKQIKQFDTAEMELAVRIGALLSRHRGTRLTEQQIRDAFRCRHAPMTFADHPKAKVEALQAQMSVAAMGPVEFYMLENPSVTSEEEAREALERNAEDRAWLNGLFVKYNLPANPADDLKTVAQLNGQVGGQRSGEVRGKQEEEENDAAE